MACKGCPSSKKTYMRTAVGQGIPSQMILSEDAEFSRVKVQYIGGPSAPHNLIGVTTKKKYGRRRKDDVFWMEKEDVKGNTEKFKVMGSAGKNPLLPVFPSDLLQPAIIKVPVIDTPVDVISFDEDIDTPQHLVNIITRYTLIALNQAWQVDGLKGLKSFDGIGDKKAEKLAEFLEAL